LPSFTMSVYYFLTFEQRLRYLNPDFTFENELRIGIHIMFTRGPNAGKKYIISKLTGVSENTVCGTLQILIRIYSINVPPENFSELPF
jgi:hypothetical protein